MHFYAPNLAVQYPIYNIIITFMVIFRLWIEVRERLSGLIHYDLFCQAQPHPIESAAVHTCSNLFIYKTSSV